MLGNVGSNVIVDLIILEETFLLLFANQQYVTRYVYAEVVLVIIIALVVVGQGQFYNVQRILTQLFPYVIQRQRYLCVNAGGSFQIRPSPFVYFLFDFVLIAVE